MDVSFESLSIEMQLEYVNTLESRIGCLELFNLLKDAKCSKVAGAILSKMHLACLAAALFRKTDLCRLFIQRQYIPIQKLRSHENGWFMSIENSMNSRRDQCRQLAVITLSMSRPGNPLRSRDIMTLIAKQLWKTRFNEEWEN